MKFTVLLTSLLAGLLTTIITHSQTTSENDPPFAAPLNLDLPRTVRVHAEFIEMPLATYTELTSKPRTSANDTDLRGHCAKLIASGEAKMLETLTINAIPGISATTESISEFIYPIGYDPPGTLSARAPRGLDEKPIPKKLNFFPVGWSSFETKNLGSTFEVEAQIDAYPAIVELRATPTLVAFSRNLVWSTWKNKETEIKTTTPMFYILSVKTGSVLVVGQPQFVASLSPRGVDDFSDPSRKVMVFFRADIITTDK